MVRGPYLATSSPGYSDGREYADLHLRDHNPLSQWGITRTLVEVFSVGNRHYPKLGKAIARARHVQAKVESHARRSRWTAWWHSSLRTASVAALRLLSKGAARLARKLGIDSNWICGSVKHRGGQAPR